MPHAVSISQTAETANLVEWAKLALDPGNARVLRVTRVLYDAPDRPIALEEVVLALDRFPGLTPTAATSQTSSSLLSAMASRLGGLLNA